MYALCVGDGTCDPPANLQSFSRQSYYGNPEYNDYPVINVSWNDAEAYCNWAGRRLPTEAEWEKAASWDEKKQQKYVYPWGIVEPGCSHANYWLELNGCIGDTFDVGHYPSGASMYGGLEMAGNVWEWVADWYEETCNNQSPSNNLMGPLWGEYRVIEVARGITVNLQCDHPIGNTEGHHISITISDFVVKAM